MPLVEIRCDHTTDKKVCKRTDTVPQFTRALSEIGKVRNRKRRSDDERQPKYFCPAHRRKHPNMSPTIVGVKRDLMEHKSFEIIDGELIPLRGGDVYGAKAS